MLGEMHLYMSEYGGSSTDVGYAICTMRRLGRVEKVFDISKPEYNHSQRKVLTQQCILAKMKLLQGIISDQCFGGCTRRAKSWVQCQLIIIEANG
jgi:hypothetical protein